MSQNKLKKEDLSDVFIVFLLLEIIASFIILPWFLPFLQINRGPYFFLITILLFLFLGITLCFVAKRWKKKTDLRKYLLWTGVSAVCMFIFILLHNFVSGLLTLIRGNDEVVEEPVFFILAVLVCPIIFTVGSIRSWIEFIRIYKK